MTRYGHLNLTSVLPLLPTCMYRSDRSILGVHKQSQPCRGIDHQRCTYLGPETNADQDQGKSQVTAVFRPGVVSLVRQYIRTSGSSIPPQPTSYPPPFLVVLVITTLSTFTVAVTHSSYKVAVSPPPNKCLPPSPNSSQSLSLSRALLSLHLHCSLPVPRPPTSTPT